MRSSSEDRLWQHGRGDAFDVSGAAMEGQAIARDVVRSAERAVDVEPLTEGGLAAQRRQFVAFLAQSGADVAGVP